MTLNQLNLFVIFLINGILIGLLFDFFRIWRKSFKHSNLITYIQDAIFWILTGFLIINTTFTFNNGEFRFYMILSSILGFSLYLWIFSNIIIKVNVKIILFFKNVVSKTINILAIPIKYIIQLIKKIFLKPFTFLVINIKKSISKITKKSIKGLKSTKIKQNTKKEKIKEGF